MPEKQEKSKCIIHQDKPNFTDPKKGYTNGVTFNSLPVYDVDELSIDEFIFIMENQKRIRNQNDKSK